MDELEKYIKTILTPEVYELPYTNTSPRIIKNYYYRQKPSYIPSHDHIRRHKNSFPIIDVVNRSYFSLTNIDNTYNPQEIYITNLSEDEEARVLLDNIRASLYTSYQDNRVIMDITFTKSSIGSESQPVVTPHDLSNTNIHSLLSSASLAGLVNGVYFGFFDHKKLKMRPASHYKMPVHLYQTYLSHVYTKTLEKFCKDFGFPEFPKLKTTENIVVFNYTFIHKSKSIPYVCNKDFNDAVVRQATTNPSVTFSLNYPRHVVYYENGPCNIVIVLTNDVEEVRVPINCLEWGPGQLLEVPSPNGGTMVVEPYIDCLISATPCVIQWGGVVWDGNSGTGLTSGSWYAPWTNHHNPAHDILEPPDFNPKPPPRQLAHLLLEQMYVFEYKKANKLAINNDENFYSKLGDLVYYHRSVVYKNKNDLDDAWRSVVQDALPSRLKTIFKALNTVSIKIPLYVAYSHSWNGITTLKYFDMQKSKEDEINRFSEIINKYKNKLPQKNINIAYRFMNDLMSATLLNSYNFEVKYKPEIADIAMPILSDSSYRDFGLYM